MDADTDIDHVRSIAQRVLANGRLTEEEWEELREAIAADGIVSAEEKAVLEEILSGYNQGEIQIE